MIAKSDIVKKYGKPIKLSKVNLPIIIKITKKEKKSSGFKELFDFLKDNKR